MKKIFSKIIVTSLVISSILGSASAISIATDYGTFGPNSGNLQWFTPSSCFIATRSNGVEFSSLKWEHASFAAMNNWEGEISLLPLSEWWYGPELMYQNSRPCCIPW